MNYVCRHLFGLIVVLGILLSRPIDAAIVGTNPPAQRLTLQRIETLPSSEQAVWKDYLERSARQRQADQAVLREELRAHKLREIAQPPHGRSKDWAPLDESTSWYAGVEPRHTADVILSFQTPAGGWSKNMVMSDKPRSPGMHFAPDNASPRLSDGDFDLPFDRNWDYVGTFDNGATILQLRFLAKVISATSTNENVRYREAFLHGIDYIAAAQYPNGGWPQVWPLSGGYHDSITFNDGAFVNVLTLLRDVAAGAGEFAFVPPAARATAEKYLQQGMKCLLAAQVVVNGRRTIWPQQCDMLTLKPCSARNYEMPSLASGESGEIVLFLMQVPNPNPEIVSAVHGAAAWFRKTAIYDKAFKSSGSEGRLLIPMPGNGPIWARYYEIGTDQPLFGDRDKTIHDTVDEISRERRAGYGWYADTGKRMLQHYSHWSKDHPVN